MAAPLQSARILTNAVEEVICWDPATSFVPRVALETVTIGDVEIPEGTIVTLSTLSANHDPEALPNAGVFDMPRTKPQGWTLLTFGAGIHFCLGAALARLELQEAIAALAEAMPNLRLAGDPIRSAAGVIDGYSALPIRWD